MIDFFLSLLSVIITLNCVTINFVTMKTKFCSAKVRNSLSLACSNLYDAISLCRLSGDVFLENYLSEKLVDIDFLRIRLSPRSCFSFPVE